MSRLGELHVKAGYVSTLLGGSPVSRAPSFHVNRPSVKWCTVIRLLFVQKNALLHFAENSHFDFLNRKCSVISQKTVRYVSDPTQNSRVLYGRWIESVWKSRSYADALKENPINLSIFWKLNSYRIHSYLSNFLKANAEVILKEIPRNNGSFKLVRFRAWIIGAARLTSEMFSHTSPSKRVSAIDINNTLLRIKQSWNGGPRGYPYYRASYLTTFKYYLQLIKLLKTLQLKRESMQMI